MIHINAWLQTYLVFETLLVESLMSLKMGKYDGAPFNFFLQERI